MYKDIGNGFLPKNQLNIHCNGIDLVPVNQVQFSYANSITFELQEK